MTMSRGLLHTLFDHSVPRLYPHVCQALQQYTERTGITLEIGCGGMQYRPFVRGRHLGMDLRADLYGGTGQELIGDARALPLPDGAVDTVFVVAALLYMDDWPKVIAEAARVLKPGGRFLVFDYKARVARRLGSPNRFTASRLVRGMESGGLTGEHHLEFLPVHRIGPLRSRWVRRLVASLMYLVSNWLVVSGCKPQQ